MSVSDELLTEVLAAHADHLNDGGDSTEEYLAMFPASRDELAPLMHLAKQLRRLLAPVEPRPAFVEQLGGSLLEAAQARLPAPPGWRDRLIVVPQWPERFWGLPELMRLPGAEKRAVLVRAAAGGAGLAAAGVAAYMLRDRFFGEEAGTTASSGPQG